MHDMYTPTCCSCDTLAATQDLHYIDLPNTPDQHGDSIPVCDSHTCWQTARDEIDERGGTFQQTVYLRAADDPYHRRAHDIEETVRFAGSYVGRDGTMEHVPYVAVTCADCGESYEPGRPQVPGGGVICPANRKAYVARLQRQPYAAAS